MTDEFSEDPDVPEHPDFVDARHFLNALSNAEEYGMEEEFVSSFFQGLRESRAEEWSEDTVPAAISFAICEWDL